MRIPVAPGVALSVRRWNGAGAPFLLVHGLASNARMWDGVADRLAEQGHAVAAVDQRGHGQSDKPDDGYDYPTLTADLTAAMDAVGFDSAVAVGQSWGANVVLELGDRHPQRVLGVVCVDGGTGDMVARFPTWSDAERILAPPDLTGIRAEDLEAKVRRQFSDWPEAGIRGALANFEVLPDGTVAPWLTRARHMTILRQLWEHRPSEVRPRLTMPVLDIEARDYDAHHDIHAQKPDLVAKLLLETFA